MGTDCVIMAANSNIAFSIARARRTALQSAPNGAPTGDKTALHGGKQNNNEHTTGAGAHELFAGMAVFTR